MTNTLLTLHDPELARRYYEQGLWRRDTLYSAAVRACGAAARRFRGTRRNSAADLARAAVDGRCGCRRSAHGRAEARRAGVGMAAQPGRVGRGVARLLAPGLCLQPVAASELPGRRDRRIAVAHPRGGVVRPARLRRRCAHRRHLRCRPGAAVIAADLCARRRPDRCRALPDRTRAAAAARCRSRQDRLSRLYLGHDRHAQRRHAFRQHVAGEWPGDGRRLGPRRALGSAEPQPDEPSHRRRRGRADDGGRTGTRRQRPARRPDPARLDHRDRRHLRDGRADPCDGHPRRDAPARARPAGRGQSLLHGRLADPARDRAGLSRPRRRCRRTSTA